MSGVEEEVNKVFVLQLLSELKQAQNGVTKRFKAKIIQAEGPSGWAEKPFSLQNSKNTCNRLLSRSRSERDMCWPHARIFCRVLLVGGENAF